MVKNCCVSKCSTVWNPYAEISLFSFPWKNNALLKEWIKVVPTNRKITANSRICSLHFHNELVEQKFGKRILKKDAIPGIFSLQERTLQGSSCLVPSCLTFSTTCQDEENEVVGNHSSSLCKVEDSSCLVPSCLTFSTTDQNEENEVVGNHSSSLCKVEGSSYFVPSCYTFSTTHQDEEIEVIGNHSNSRCKVEMKSVDTQVAPHLLKPSTRELEYQRKIKILQCKLRRREKRLLTMSRLIKELKQSCTSSDALEKIFTGFNLELFRNQSENYASKKIKRSYFDKMKEFATTLYFLSPKAYVYVRKQLVALPHPSTSRKWVAKYRQGRRKGRESLATTRGTNTNETPKAL